MLLFRRTHLWFYLREKVIDVIGVSGSKGIFFEDFYFSCSMFSVTTIAHFPHMSLQLPIHPPGLMLPQLQSHKVEEMITQGRKKVIEMHTSYIILR